LLRGYDAQDAIALDARGAVTCGEFLTRAAELARALPHKAGVLNLCEDRLHFVLGLAAALQRGMTTLLPATRASASLLELYGDGRDTACIADTADVPTQLEITSVVHAGEEAASAPSVPELPSDLRAAIVFTSGTTGRPVPWAKTWGSLVAGAEVLGRALGLDAGPRRAIAGTIPPQHMFGLETSVMLPLQWGGIMHRRRPLLPADIRAVLESMPAPRWLMTTPLHLRTCVEEGGWFAPLEGIVSSTMPLAPALAQQAEARFGAPVHEIYGCTEAGMIAVRQPARDQRWTLCEGLRLMHRDGDATISGGHLDHEVQLADGVRRIDERRFELTGRDADLVKIGGKRASLEALNLELNRIAGVADGVFYAPDDLDDNGGRLAAVAVAPGLTAQAIVQALRERIDPVFLPRPLILVTELPRTALGKVARASLRELTHRHRRARGR
jgi:acyl-coenzyme A synthetase/AMP-(fatty) acid ligase